MVLAILPREDSGGNLAGHGRDRGTIRRTPYSDALEEAPPGLPVASA
jgi:hypothetical protein